jgi:hypothetical protein
MFLLLGLEHFSRKNIDTLAAMINIENNQAIRRSEQGIIFTPANVQTGLDAGATLTDKDIARKNKLASIAFNAQALGIRVTTVAA